MGKGGGAGAGAGAGEAVHAKKRWADLGWVLEKRGPLPEVTGPLFPGSVFSYNLDCF